MDWADELLDLTRALRAHAEWQQVCGASDLPAAVSTQEAPRASPPVRRPEPTPAEARAPARSTSPRSPAPPSEVPPVPAGLPAAAPGPSADDPQRLQLLAEEVAQCMRCGLHSGRKQTVFARGTGSARLCFVGEGPGADEDEQGLPFVGKAGQLLDRMIAAMGFERDEVYVCNIVKCRPPNNRKPQPDEIAACVGYVQQQIDLIAPEVIVALGATAVEGLFGSSVGITRMRGRFKLYKGRIAVMPTFHPAYLLRNPAAKREVWEDLQAVLRLMGREPPAKRK